MSPARYHGIMPTVLIIDDEEAIAWGLKRAFAGAGYDVAVAACVPAWRKPWAVRAAGSSALSAGRAELQSIRPHRASPRGTNC